MSDTVGLIALWVSTAGVAATASRKEVAGMVKIARPLAAARCGSRVVVSVGGMLSLVKPGR